MGPEPGLPQIRLFARTWDTYYLLRRVRPIPRDDERPGLGADLVAERELER